MVMMMMMHIEDLIRDDGTEEVGDAPKGLVAHHHAALLHHTALCHHMSSSVLLKMSPLIATQNQHRTNHITQSNPLME